MDTDYILATTELRMEFKGFLAVDGVSLKIRRGAIHALIGPNGAGKDDNFQFVDKVLAASRNHSFQGTRYYA